MAEPLTASAAGSTAEARPRRKKRPDARPEARPLPEPLDALYHAAQLAHLSHDAASGAARTAQETERVRRHLAGEPEPEGPAALVPAEPIAAGVAAWYRRFFRMLQVAEVSDAVWSELI